MSENPVDSSVSSIAQSVERNKAIAATANGSAKQPQQAPPPPPPATPAPAPKPSNGNAQKVPKWHHEPISNFVLDKDGKPVIREDGRPVRRSCRPRKPRPGDRLAGGGVFGGDSAAVTNAQPPRQASGPPSQVVVPGEAMQHATPWQDDTAGEDFGRVVTDGMMNAWTGLVPEGNPRRPTTEERAAIERHLSKVLGRRNVPAWLALAIVFLFVGCRIVIATSTSKKEKAKDADPPTDHRANAVGENDDRKTVVNQITWPVDSRSSA